jgi:hypothetical protein
VKLIPFLFTFLTLASKGQTFDPPVIPKVFQEASFCIAYEIKDADKREERLITDSGILGDGPEKKIPYIPPSGVVISSGHLDLASLISRTTRQKKLTKKQLASLNQAAFKSKVLYPRMACHDPHHIFLFYNEHGMPTACLEVCLSCNTIKFAHRLLDPPPLPEESEDGKIDDNWRAITLEGDILAIATLCDQLGLGLGNYESLEAIQKGKNTVKKK